MSSESVDSSESSVGLRDGCLDCARLVGGGVIIIMSLKGDGVLPCELEEESVAAKIDASRAAPLGANGVVETEARCRGG